MTLSRTATRSLALPSAVSALGVRTQLQRSQLFASFGRVCPQTGQLLGSAATAISEVGASVYSKSFSSGNSTLKLRMCQAPNTRRSRKAVAVHKLSRRDIGN